MKQSLTIPADIVERALKAAFSEHLANIDLEDVKLYTAKEAAGMLKLTQQGFRRIAKDQVDFGPQSKRWSLKDIRHLIELRRVKGR
jgi:hypothetical protein